MCSNFHRRPDGRQRLRPNSANTFEEYEKFVAGDLQLMEMDDELKDI